MSKKNKNKTFINKFFDKSADIITSDSNYHIRKARVFIHSSKQQNAYYGKILTISSPSFNNSNVHEIREIYESPDDRFRIRLRRYNNAKKFRTIEKNENNSIENKIAVIEYDDFDEFIYSIGDITTIKSDLIKNDNEKYKKNNIKILKLVLPKEEKYKKEEHI